MKTYKRLYVCILILVTIHGHPVVAQDIAQDITSQVGINPIEQLSLAALTNQNPAAGVSIPAGSILTITSDYPIGSLYIQFNKPPAAPWQMGAEGAPSVTCGANGFLHEYVDVAQAFGAPVQSFTIQFADADYVVGEMTFFAEGKPPSWVQRWQPPAEGQTDLLLFSTHSDDEHLFFAGILPDTTAKGLTPQVVYMTNHFDNTTRLHEQLDGLWAAGVTHYPLVGPFPDLYAESLEGALAAFQGAGYSEEDFLAFQVDMLRRFKPYVAVGHDFKGEYGHGAHMLNAGTLARALDMAADGDSFPQSATQYGVWDTPKAYIHLYTEGLSTVNLNMDTPLEAYNGQSAFAVSQKGYDYHRSQHWTWFTQWLLGTQANPITQATQIKSYSPLQFGLYRSTVGQDETGQDFWEHITPYGWQPVAEVEESPAPTATPALTPSPILSPPASLAKHSTQTLWKQKGMVVFTGFVAAAVLGLLSLLANVFVKRRQRYKRH